SRRRWRNGSSRTSAKARKRRKASCAASGGGRHARRRGERASSERGTAGPRAPSHPPPSAVPQELPELFGGELVGAAGAQPAAGTDRGRLVPARGGGRARVVVARERDARQLVSQ